MLRIFCAAFGAEVNTFSPLPLDRSSFEALWHHKAGTLSQDVDPPLIAAPLRRAWALQSRGEAVVTQGLCAGAQPGGPIARFAYETMRDELLDDLKLAGPFDVVVLGLHGATVAGGYDDCDGDLLARTRALVGEGVVVAALLDPHCHLTPTMLSATDLMFAYKEYPHDDIFAVADHLVDEAVRLARGEITPVVRAFDCRTLGSFNTYHSPMRGFVDELIAETAADPRVIDISIAHGFPWGDVMDVGTRVWVTSDGDADFAAERAEHYGRRLMDIRSEAQGSLMSISSVLQQIARREGGSGPIIIAETSDNPGGGAPSDSTYLLRALMNAGVQSIAAALFWDPVAVSICEAAGEGALIPLRVGGKASRLSGDPLDLEVRVIRILDDLRQPFGGGLWPTGTAVRVETNSVTLILTRVRTQCLATEAFTALGVDLSTKRAVIVKSSNHFEASFKALSDRIVRVASPGVLASDFTTLPYRHVRRPIWPLDAAPPGEPFAFPART